MFVDPFKIPRSSRVVFTERSRMDSIIGSVVPKEENADVAIWRIWSALMFDMASSHMCQNSHYFSKATLPTYFLTSLPIKLS